MRRPSNVPTRIALAVAALMGLLAAAPDSAPAQSAWYDGFERMESSWTHLGGDAQLAQFSIRRTPQVQHTGERSEWIRVVGEAGSGTYVHVGHDVGRPRVIDELAPSLQIRADRAGIQLLAEITLPRTTHPQTGHTLTTLIRGTSYSNVGQWQQLRIDDLPRLLTRQTHILRNEFGPAIDAREAYVSRIVLNVYGGPGETNVWIDDLDIAGYVQAQVASPQFRTVATDAVPSAPAPWTGMNYPDAENDSERRVRLDHSILLVDNRPFFVRAARHRGEPLTVLKVLGFNTVWLDRFPTPETLAEADRTGMWLISPAPPMPPAQSPLGTAAPMSRIGPEYCRVLAWDLGAGLRDHQIEAVRAWAEQIRTADSRDRRPLIARPETSLKAYSRIADILVIGRPVLGSSLELADYAQWLRLRPRLARPGTPVWIVVPTDPEPALVAQWQMMSQGVLPPTGFSPEQLRLATYVSAVGGARGLLFESHLPLDGNDRGAETRRAALELLNLEFSLIEPWLAGGSFVSMAQSVDPTISAAVFRTDRSRLVLPIWIGEGGQQVPGPSAQRTISVVVPGAGSASDNAYQMLPGRLHPLRDKRVTGGRRVTIDKFTLTAQVLLTQDPLTQNSRSRQAAQIGRRAAELQRRLTELKLEQFENSVVPLTLAAPGTPQLKALERDVPALRRAARQSLQTCDGSMAARDYGAAYAAAEEATRPFLLLEREHWLAASRSLPGTVASPGMATFAGLPAHWTLLRDAGQSMPSANRMPGGDFENLQIWQGAGWEYLQRLVPGVTAQADLAAEAAHSGSFGLRLSARPADPKQVPQIVETSPVWITSPPVSLPARSLVVIRGWVRIDQPIESSVDGLLVIDSLTGQTLAERIDADDQWQEFVLYRACPQAGPVRLTFALSGLGTAYVDDISIQTLAPATPPLSAAGRLPRTQ